MAPVKYPGLKEAILYNETRSGESDFLTVEELSKKFGCKVSYIYRLRYILGLKGGSTKPQSLSNVHTSARIDSEGQLKDLLEEPLLSPLDRLKILSKLIRTGAPPIKIAAIKAMEELTRTSEGRIGPPAPMTDDAKVSRLARLLLAIPQEISAQAWETAYGYPPTTAPTRKTLRTVPEPAERASHPLEESLSDLPIPSNRGEISVGGPQPQDPDSSGTPV